MHRWANKSQILNITFRGRITFSYKPNIKDNFQKSKNAAQKPNYAKRISTLPDSDIVMDKLDKISDSRNNSASQSNAIAESSQVVKESAFQFDVTAESSA